MQVATPCVALSEEDAERPAGIATQSVATRKNGRHIMIHLTLPLLGEGMIEAEVGRWLKQPGDVVQEGEPLVEIETDKVTTEVVAEAAGVLREILVAAGEMARVNQPIAVMGETAFDANGSADAPVAKEMEQAVDKATPAPAANSVTQTTSQPTSNAADNFEPRPYQGRISPVVARMVEANALDLNHVPGTGQEGRITKKDVQNFLEAQPDQVNGDEPQTPQSPPSPKPNLQSPIPNLANGQLHPLTPMRRTIADHMLRSKQTSPHATTVFELDFHAVAAHRDSHKADYAQRHAKLTYTAYIAAAIVEGLRAVPAVNSRWQDDGIFLHNAVHLGLAVAVEGGLVVPVIRDAQRLNLFGLAQAVGDVATRARDGVLQPSEMRDGTFTITNHGVFGSLFATPIINQPQCGILGVGAIEERVCVIAGMIAIRPRAYFSFSFDHRILDGAQADRFMQVVKRQIEEWT